METFSEANEKFPGVSRSLKLLGYLGDNAGLMSAWQVELPDYRIDC